MSDLLARARNAWHAVARQGAVGVGAVLLGVSSLVSAGGWLHTEVQSRDAEGEQRDHLDDLRDRNRRLTRQLERLTDELACRSEAATEAGNIQAEKMDALGAALLFAFVDDNDQAALEQAERFRGLRDDEQAALQRRSEAIKDCEGGG